MPRAYLGLGSNVGRRLGYLRAAVKVLSTHHDITVTRVSSYYETKPVGGAPQRDYLNAVVEIQTGLEPQELLGVCRMTEELLGRARLEKWGPRTIDVDILLYGSLVVQEKDLIVPHPEMTRRAFVLVPLAEIAPQARFPGGTTVAAALEAISTEGVVKKDRLIDE